MSKLAVAAATITFGALLASAPVQALNGQVQREGKCFYPAAGMARDLQFGNWGECPKAAGGTGGAATSLPGSPIPGLHAPKNAAAAPGQPGSVKSFR
jgi:hypothetical protein